MSGLDELKVCTHYTLDGRRTERVPANLEKLAQCKPKYVRLPGWDEIERSSLEKMIDKGYTALPANMKAYVKFVERQMNVPVVVLGLGPARREILDLRRRRWRSKV